MPKQNKMSGEGLFNASRLYETLKEQELLPNVAKEDLNVRGAYSPKNNSIYLDDASRNTVAHEFTHGVQANLLEATASYLHNLHRKEKQDLSKEEAQFLDTYNKLMGTKFGGAWSYETSKEKDIKKNQKDYVQKLVFDRLNEESDFAINQPLSEEDYLKAYQQRARNWYKYRTTPRELQGWGVGNMSSPVFDSAIEQLPAHTDPTMTTEFDILLSMYEKLPQNVREQSASKRKSEIKDYEFSNLTEDPFKNPLLK